ncbi:MAG TPA: glycosyltransferase [Thermococcus sp.]|nr:glycosyltransferase [Thermococcus sp.]
MALKFSVIITSAAKSEIRQIWLFEALTSVLSQSYPYWECIVVDDTGEQLLKPMVERAQGLTTNPILYVPNLCNLGLQKSFNIGLFYAAGDWIVRLDDDDQFYPCTLNELALFIQKCSNNVVFVHSDIAFMHGGVYSYPEWDGTLEGTERIGHVQAIKRQALLQIGGWRTDIDYAADTDCVIRLLEMGWEIRHIPKVLYLNRHHEDQYTVWYAKHKDPIKAKRRVFQDALKRNYEFWRYRQSTFQPMTCAKVADVLEAVKKYLKGNGIELGMQVIGLSSDIFASVKDEMVFEDERLDYVLIFVSDLSQLIKKKILLCSRKVKRGGHLILVISRKRDPEWRQGFLIWITNKFRAKDFDLIQLDTAKEGEWSEWVLKKRC